MTEDFDAIIAIATRPNEEETREKPTTIASDGNDLSEASKVVKCVQVLAAFTLFFNTWGLLNAFGEYQTYYETGSPFRTSSSHISWIGSLQSFLLLFVGFITGPVYDAGHLRMLLVAGTDAKLCWHLLGSPACPSIGAGCLFVPSVTVITGYFSNKLPAAIGIAASGSSLGGIIYPIMFHKLVPQIGFPWTVRIMGFMALVLLLIPCTLLRMRIKPAARRRIVDFSAFQELPYNLFILGGVLGFMGLLVPFFYISFFGIATGTVNENLGFYLLPMLNATSIFGRIAPNILANKIGPLNVFVPAVAVSGILALCLIPCTTEGSLLAVDLMWGFFSGTFVSLPPSVIVSLTPPQKRGTLGTRIGMGFCVIGLGMLAGPPIAGAILGSAKNLHFTSIWIFAGCVLFASTVLFVAARIAKAGLRLEKC